MSDKIRYFKLINMLIILAIQDNTATEKITD